MTTSNSQNMYYFTLIHVKQENDVKVEASEEEAYINNNWQPKVVIERLPSTKNTSLFAISREKVTIIARSRGSLYSFREKKRISIDIR